MSHIHVTEVLFEINAPARAPRCTMEIPQVWALSRPFPTAYGDAILAANGGVIAAQGAVDGALTVKPAFEAQSAAIEAVLASWRALLKTPWVSLPSGPVRLSKCVPNCADRSDGWISKSKFRMQHWSGRAGSRRSLRSASRSILRTKLVFAACRPMTAFLVHTHLDRGRSHAGNGQFYLKYKRAFLPTTITRSRAPLRGTPKLFAKI